MRQTQYILDEVWCEFIFFFIDEQLQQSDIIYGNTLLYKH